MTADDKATANAIKPQEEIDSFLRENKSKKDPTKADAAKFESLWLAYVNAEGLNDSAIELLRRGFKYCAAKPLFDYYRSLGDSSLARYGTLPSFAVLRKNTTEIGMRLYTSLLAQELVEPSSPEQVVWLMGKIPGVSYNKENKLSGNALQYVRKLLVSEIAGKEIKAKKLDYGKDESRVRSFARFILPLLKQIKDEANLKKNEKRALDEVASWLSDYADNEKSIPTDEEETVRALSPDAPHSQDQGSADSISANDVISFVRAGEKELARLGRRVEELEQENTRFREGAEEKAKKLIACNTEICGMKKRIQEMEQREATLASSLRVAESLAESRKVELGECGREIDSLKSELEDSKLLQRIAEEGNKKECDANMTKLARKLKAAYLDFLDGEKIEMSIDLGNNMRDSLADVFGYLREAGIEF